jgi:hypothetical protein
VTAGAVGAGAANAAPMDRCDTTPAMSSAGAPETMRDASSANTRSPSPDTIASTNENCRSVSTPIVASQFAPPITTKTPGSRSFTRLASASDARCCWNTLVKPTIAGRAATMRSAQSSTKAHAASRAARMAFTSARPGGLVWLRPSHDGGFSSTSLM